MIHIKTTLFCDRCKKIFDAITDEQEEVRTLCKDAEREGWATRVETANLDWEDFCPGCIKREEDLSFLRK